MFFIFLQLHILQTHSAIHFVLIFYLEPDAHSRVYPLKTLTSDQFGKTPKIHEGVDLQP